MSKKKKSKAQVSAAAAAPAPVVRPHGQLDFAEVLQHPTLMLAGISALFALVSAILAVKFHDDMSAGALREPTGMILWSAIGATLFASYWRERVRARPRS